MGIWSISPCEGVVPPCENSDGKFTFKPNTSYSERHFTVKYTDGSTMCSVPVVQKPKTCSCDDLTLNPSSVSAWDWDDTTPKTVRISYESCITGVRQTTTTPHFNVSGIDSGIITIHPKGENTDTTPYEDTLTISYNALGVEGGCSKSIQLTQNVNACNCGNLRISPTSLTWEWDNTNTQTVKITADSCVNLDSVTATSTSSDFSVSRNGNIISIKPKNKATDARDGTVTVSYTAGVHSCSSSITIHQDAQGCACSCSQVKKIYNEEGEPFYFYTLTENLTTTPPQPLSDVPFGILTADTTFDCEIQPEAVDGGITDIHCAEYKERDWTGGTGNWRTSFFQKFRTYCADLARTCKVYVIYGTLSAVEGDDEKRASGFRYYVCDSVCEDGTIFRVFQRCACGMDNCKNDYTLEEAGGHNILTEDRPLYIESCYGEWLQGDSICVEKLSVTGARLYKVTNMETGEKECVISSSFTPHGDTYIIRDKDKEALGWDKQLNPAYVISPPYPTSISSAYEHNVLWLINQGNIKLSIWVASAGIDSGRGMVEYIVDMPRHDYEQLIEVDYVTGENLKMTAGPTVGWCALEKFTVSIFIAPNGYGYTKEGMTGEDYKRKLIKCCYCGETRIGSITPNVSIPAAGSSDYITICTIDISEGCRSHEAISLVKNSGSDIIKVENNELQFDYWFITEDKQIIVTALINPNAGSAREENLTLEIFFNYSTPCSTTNITIKQLG